MQFKTISQRGKIKFFSQYNANQTCLALHNDKMA